MKIQEPEDGEPQTIHPNKEQLSRRCAIVPEQPHAEQDSSKPTDGCCSTDNVIIVPHVQISTNESHLFNRAISSGGGILADLQRATIATQAFYAEMPDQSKNRSPWILKRLYEWSNRAKRREIIKHVQAALEVSKDHEIEDDELEKLLVVSWEEMFEGATDLTAEKQKYLQAVWELFHSELIFLHRQLLVLRNVYKEPLKKIQVEGCLLLVEPDLLFGNLDQLLRISRTFCQSFLTFLQEVEKTTWNCTNLVVQLFERKGIAMGKSEHYIVQRQPVPLDSCIFCDADSNDSTTSMQLKFAFVIIHLTRYYQVVAIYTLQAADKHDKDTWIEKFQESIENYESIQLKDMLKCTPLFTSLSLRRFNYNAQARD
ncbi:hypothetical protein WR25_16105 [Diploscapter pachys]|uniref:DH domain-containing protein n=1 Tax=Diploscapter pachys TaxID=2018661 RepID=A0A2A2LBB9_9BILA|nr:hypothetical protein WR25_16105 [Diploscapter pachys]